MTHPEVKGVSSYATVNVWIDVEHPPIVKP